MSTLGLDRAPALRRLAQRIEDMAERSADPATARALARRIRIRAAALESGREDESLAAALMADELG